MYRSASFYSANCVPWTMRKAGALHLSSGGGGRIHRGPVRSQAMCDTVDQVGRARERESITRQRTWDKTCLICANGHNGSAPAAAKAVFNFLYGQSEKLGPSATSCHPSLWGPGADYEIVVAKNNLGAGIRSTDQPTTIPPSGTS